jgi:hypothetical protein
MTLAAMGCYCAYTALRAPRWRAGWATTALVYWLASVAAVGLAVGGCR